MMRIGLIQVWKYFKQNELVGWSAPFGLSVVLLSTILPQDSVAQETKILAENVLEMSLGAIGTREAVSGARFIYVDADCNGPNGPFKTKIWSSRSGHVRFEQRSPRGSTVGGINASGAWLLREGVLEEVDESSSVFFQTHELHMIALAPLTRFEKPLHRGRDLFNETAVAKVEFLDKTGKPLYVFYDLSSKLPLGMRIATDDHQPIEIRFLHWKGVGMGLRLFTRAEFVQGAHVFLYDYSEILFNNFDESAFDPEFEPSTK